MMNENATETLASCVRRSAIVSPEKPALVHNGRPISYRQMWSDVAGLANRFRQDCYKPESRVLIDTENKYLVIASIAAAMAIGAIPVPFSGDRPLFDKIRENASPSLTICRSNWVGSLEGTLDEAELSGDLGQFGELDLALQAAADEAIGMLLYTSGTTTGTPRGVILSQGVLKRTADYIAEVQGLDDSVYEYVMPPIHHAFGLGRCRTVLHNGGTLILDDGAFNPLTCLASIKRNPVNALSGVSTMFALLLDKLVAPMKSFASDIRWIEVGSLPLTDSHSEIMGTLFENSTIIMNYGLTEAMRSTFMDLRQIKVHPGSVGRAAPGVSIRIADEDGEPVSSDTVGRIQISGANLASGYWHAMDQWQQRLVNEWFDTGDSGTLDADGFLRYRGRTDNVINIAGEKVSAESIEAALAPLLADTAYAVAGIDDPDGLRGMVPALFVETSVDALGNDFHNQASKLLPAQFLPRKVISVPALPRTPNGKIIRSRLRTPNDES